MGLAVDGLAPGRLPEKDAAGGMREARGLPTWVGDLPSSLVMVLSGGGEL